MSPPDAGEVLLRLAIDVVALAVLTYGVFYRRHRRRDLFVVCSMFNVGLFVALVVIESGEVSVGVGFGLFAVLSIIRLRSEPFSNSELGYFFLAIVIALVTGIDIGDVALAAGLAVVVLVAAVVIDHPRLLQATRRIELTLEVIPPGDDALRQEVESRLGIPVLDLRVLEIDYVRETVRVAARCAAVAPPAAPGRTGKEPGNAVGAP